MNQLISVVEIDVLSHTVNDFVGLVEGDLEAIRDGRGVETLCEEVLACLKKSTSHDDDRGCSITGFDILSF